MNPLQKPPFLSRATSKMQTANGLRKIGSALALVVSVGCARVQAAEIHDAAEFGNLAKLKACLALDPNQINSADSKGRTVLARAALSGKQEIVEFVLEHGATEDIFAAAMVGHTEKLAALLKKDPKRANAKDSSGKAALHWAALYGQKKAVELLLAAKAQVNALDGDGFTALHWAVMFNKTDVVVVLVTNKADLTVQVAKFGWTPLRLAVIHGHLATAEALLKAGADPNAPDGQPIPLLHQAIILGKKEMVALLLANKVDINKKDPEGETPLGEALEQGNTAMIEFLRQRGAKEK